LDFGFEQEANNGGVVGPSSPPSGGCFSQSRNWPVGFDHNGEIVVWEEEEWIAFRLGDGRGFWGGGFGYLGCHGRGILVFCGLED